MLICPKCKQELNRAIFYNTEVDYCSQCLGLWFDQEELRLAKDDKDKNLNWLDIDLWEDEKSFKVSRGTVPCPSCRLPLYEVYYGDSRVLVDLCNLCQGVWLDRGEFKKIIDYLRDKRDYEIFNRYFKNLTREFWEIFSGPETLREEALDFLIISKLLKYKLLAQYPQIAKVIFHLPKWC